MTTILLPWPPSVNHYWRRAGRRTIISKEGREFRNAVTIVALRQKPRAFGRARLEMQITLCPPDRRRRDIDNSVKATQDALQKVGVFDDDEQIDGLYVSRGPVTPGGKAVVRIREQKTEDIDIVEQAERYLANPASGRNVVAYDLIRRLVTELKWLRGECGFEPPDDEEDQE